jgi:hypothetical protein
MASTRVFRATEAPWMAPMAKRRLGMAALILPVVDHEHRLMGREATVFDALAAFEDLVRAGQVLDAIILTNSGKLTESPIGIVTVADVPRLNQLVMA